MTNLPNLRHLLAAMEVSDCGSISKASTRVHLSQSALTQAVSKLERNLNVSLFSRTATGVITTTSGQQFFDRVNRGYQWLKAIENLVCASKQLSHKRIVRNFSTSQLRALIAVVEKQSYTRAAAHLGLSQPTVHRAVRELEAICQQAFFQRSPQGVVPTWQARQISRFASLCFAEIQQGMVEIDERQGLMKGTLTVGALPLSRTRLVPQAVIQLLEEYPDTNVRIIDGPYDEQLNALLHGQLDLIVGALRSPQPSPDIVQELLFSDPLSIVVKPDHWLSQHREVTARELRQLRWIAPRENTPSRALFTHFFEREGLEPPQNVIECSSLVAIRGLLLESDCAALLPAKQVEIEVIAGLLAVSPQTLSGTTRDIGITLRKDWQPTHVQQRFLTLLRKPK